MSADEFLRLLPTIVSMVGSLLTAAVAGLALSVNAAVNLRNKRLDVIMHCNQRYDDIYKFKISIQHKLSNFSEGKRVAFPKMATIDRRSEVDSDVKLYYRRFWGLKSDQIDYWLAGYVDPETIISWFVSTIDAFKDVDGGDRAFSGKGFLEGWRDVEKSHEVINRSLVGLVNDIIKMRLCDKEKVEQLAELHLLLEKIERDQSKIINLLSSKRFWRRTMNALEGTLDGPTASEIERLRETRGLRRPSVLDFL